MLILHVFTIYGINRCPVDNVLTYQTESIRKEFVYSIEAKYLQTMLILAADSLDHSYECRIGLLVARDGTLEDSRSVIPAKN